MIAVTQDDVEAAARTLWGEARGETQAGRQAVMWVIVNRVTDEAGRWPRTVTAVVRQPRQFSCWNALRAPCNLVGLGNEAFRQCHAAAWEVIGGLAPDPTYGSNHYLTRALAEASPPSWFSWEKVRLHSGAHLFLCLGR